MDCGICCIKHWHGKEFEKCACSCHLGLNHPEDHVDPKAGILKANMDYFLSVLENPNLVLNHRAEALYCSECMQEITEEDLFHTCRKKPGK